jgi:hypothetical protein
MKKYEPGTDQPRSPQKFSSTVEIGDKMVAAALDRSDLKRGTAYDTYVTRTFSICSFTNLFLFSPTYI